MKDKIKWPAGNRIDLCIPLRKITVTEEGTQFGEYIPSQAAVVMVYLVGNYASYEFTPRIEDNKLFITDNGELKPGVYAIDVRIQEPERQLRSFRCGELEIVRETKQLALGDFVLDNNITLDADAFIFGEGPSAYEVAVRDGYTGTKAEWLESMRGKEGRGIADIVALPTGAFRILLTDGSAYVTPILKGEQGVSIVDFTVSSITSQEVICTITMSDGTTRTVNLPHGEKGEQGDAGEDGRGIQSVVMNNDYTITFSYTDGTSYTTPQALRGEQGAAGQDGQDGRGISSMTIDNDNHLTVSYTDGTSYTTPQSLQGERGVSITDFEQVGENATMTFFNISFSNGNISQIGLPKGEQGDRGETGPQGRQGDTVVLGEVGEYKLYNIGGTATDGAMTQDATTKAIAASNGYYECSTAAGTAAKVAVGDNEALYTLLKGGSIKVKMTNANAADSGVTLKIGSAAATPLYYNGEAVSASNTWESGEVISVYYDGTNYQATNAQGGEGKAAKIKYDNSQSGLASNNVQGALDELSQNSAREIKCTWYQGTIKGLDGSDNATTTRIRSEYIGVKKGNTVMVTPNGQNVAIYLYNTDKTSALGRYALLFINTDYIYTCPQDGYVRFVAAKADTSETIIPSELLADIIMCPPVYMPCLVNNKVLTSTDFTQGAIKGADGTDNAATTRLRSEYFPIRKGDIINVEYNSQKVRIVTYNVDKTLLYDTLWYDKRYYVVTQDGFVRFTLSKEDGSETFLPSELTASISLPIRNDIIDLNDGDNLIPTIKRQPRLNNTTQGNVLTFLHFTDIHLGRNFELARLIKFKNRYSSWIDDILNTGDLQDRGFESGISWFNQVDGHENILNVIGNHDAYKSGANNWENETSLNVYNRFISPYVSNWGVSQPSGASSSGLNYWYKDYSAYNIRLIAIDCIYWNATQNTWLESVLSSVPSGWSVICASHYKPAMTFIDCNMTDLILQPTTMSGTLNSQATDTIQNFIDNNNNNCEFICWLCGHEHKDYVGVVSTHSDQLVIGCATASMGSNRTVYCAMDRVDGEKSQDLFNVIGFDTYNKHIRILRVGADFDTFMRSKKTLCINYETHDIIAQS